MQEVSTVSALGHSVQEQVSLPWVDSIHSGVEFLHFTLLSEHGEQPFVIEQVSPSFWLVL